MCSSPIPLFPLKIVNDHPKCSRAIEREKEQEREDTRTVTVKKTVKQRANVATVRWCSRAFWGAFSFRHKLPSERKGARRGVDSWNCYYVCVCASHFIATKAIVRLTLVGLVGLVERVERREQVVVRHGSFFSTP